jgi:hypothetical protein
MDIAERYITPENVKVMVLTDEVPEIQRGFMYDIYVDGNEVATYINYYHVEKYLTDNNIPFEIVYVNK